MPLFVWEEKFSVNIAAIDEQHRGLIDVINEFHEAMLQNKSREALDSIIDQLVKYTIDHFDYEEALLKKYDYPGLEEHQEKHQKMRYWVDALRRDHLQGRVVASITIMDYLKGWLAEHILGTDQLYKYFLNSEGVY